MQRRFIKLAFFLIVIQISGCYTIYFHNHDRNENKYSKTVWPPTGPENEIDNTEWHRNIFFGLIESSDPINLSKRCKGKNWDLIKIQKDDRALIFDEIQYILLSTQLLGFWRVETICKKFEKTP